MGDRRPALLHRLEDVDGPDDVDERPTQRVRGAERDLEGSHVDDGGDRVAVQGRLDRRRVAHVAARELEVLQLVLREQEAQAVQVVAPAEDDWPVTGVKEASHDPGTKAARPAGNEDRPRGGVRSHHVKPPAGTRAAPVAHMRSPPCPLSGSKYAGRTSVRLTSRSSRSRAEPGSVAMTTVAYSRVAR
jgi:hypothetical protein